MCVFFVIVLLLFIKERLFIFNDFKKYVLLIFISLYSVNIYSMKQRILELKILILLDVRRIVNVRRPHHSWVGLMRAASIAYSHKRRGVEATL